MKNLPTEEIVSRWKKGVSKRELAEEYKVSVDTIHKRIEEYRNKMDIRRILKKPDIIIDYLRRGLSIEQIQETALESKVIIPEEVMEKAIQTFRQNIISGEEK